AHHPHWLRPAAEYRQGPSVRRPAGGQREGVGGEDAGGDRDERERHRERLEVAQRTDELLAVAEPGEFLVVRDGTRRDLIHVSLRLPWGVVALCSRRRCGPRCPRSWLRD